MQETMAFSPKAVHFSRKLARDARYINVQRRRRNLTLTITLSLELMPTTKILFPYLCLENCR